jgi:hypothetical protein
MGLFNRRKKVIDLTERYRTQQNKKDGVKVEQKETKTEETSSGGIFSFLGSMASSATPSPGSADSEEENAEDKKTRLAKRLLEMTKRIEDMSNQIYHLQQRIDLLDKKMNVGRNRD